MSPEKDWRTVIDALREAREVVVFTGAGVSAESGIATFRDEGGFWQRFPPDEFANWAGLLKVAATDPSRFCDFLLAVLEPIATAEPNAAHRAIADLERSVNVTVVTQNIDGLHQSAGSTVVKEIHGTLFETIDVRTERFRRLVSREEVRKIISSLRKSQSGPFVAARVMAAIQPLFGIDRHGGHRPNLVLFGDALAEPHWSQSVDAVRACDVLLSVGTSGVVYPAATLPHEAHSTGAVIVTIDPEEAGHGLWLQGRAADILTRLVQEAFPGAG